MLQGAKIWDHWHNDILGMCEMADIKTEETQQAFEERTIYWMSISKFSYLTVNIRFMLVVVSPHRERYLSSKV